MDVSSGNDRSVVPLPRHTSCDLSCRRNERVRVGHLALFRHAKRETPKNPSGPLEDFWLSAHDHGTSNILSNRGE